jgi:peroxiredoxin
MCFVDFQALSASFRLNLRLLLSILLIIGLQGCVEDLAPSDKDERRLQTQILPDFTARTTDGSSAEGELVELAALLSQHEAVVLYFTMWCPLCDTHMSYIAGQMIEQYPEVAFLMVDYVSASVVQSRRSQIENGYQALTILADIDQTLLDQFRATMATTVVIDAEGNIRLNEDFKNGARVKDVLDAL